jgi:hypothetical protein
MAVAPKKCFLPWDKFAVQETKRTWSEHNLTDIPKRGKNRKGLYTYLQEHIEYPGVDLTVIVVDYGLVHHRFDVDG